MKEQSFTLGVDSMPEIAQLLLGDFALTPLCPLDLSLCPYQGIVRHLKHDFDYDSHMSLMRYNFWNVR